MTLNQQNRVQEEEEEEVVKNSDVVNEQVNPMIDHKLHRISRQEEDYSG